MNKFPPRGYRRSEHPLPHNFGNVTVLYGEDETKNSMIFTLLRTSEACLAPDTIEVNPEHASFGEDVGALIQKGSIVPRINLRIYANMTKDAIETDKMRTIKFNWMPIYISFLDSLEAEDSKTAVQIEDILELQHDTTNKDVYPLHSTVKLGGNHPLSNKNAVEVLGDYGLTTTAVQESVAFDKQLFFDALQYYTNSGMLKRVTGKMRTVTIGRDRPYVYHSNNFTNPSVKRGNPYTFCGILYHVPQGDSADQVFGSSDTTNITHLRVSTQVRFDEWNPDFDQTYQ